MLHRWPSSFVLQVGGSRVRCAELPAAKCGCVCSTIRARKDLSKIFPCPFVESVLSGRHSVIHHQNYTARVEATCNYAS